MKKVNYGFYYTWEARTYSGFGESRFDICTVPVMPESMIQRIKTEISSEYNVFHYEIRITSVIPFVEGS